MGVSAQSDAPADLTPVNFLATHFTVGWMSPRAVRMAVEKRKKYLAKTDFEP
jgi:hypothetical protein